MSAKPAIRIDATDIYTADQFMDFVSALMTAGETAFPEIVSIGDEDDDDDGEFEAPHTRN